MKIQKPTMKKCVANTDINNQITVIVCPTTGGEFQIPIWFEDTVVNLLKKIARHLQTPQERLQILFKQKVLKCGKLSEHQIQDGSKITLVPAVESGFSSTVQGTQQSVVQAIENLSDAQIDDFLSGRAPLTLALRVGEHMMFVQLQLEQSLSQSYLFCDDLPGNPASNIHQSLRTSHFQHRYNHVPPGLPPIHIPIDESQNGIPSLSSAMSTATSCSKLTRSNSNFIIPSPRGGSVTRADSSCRSKTTTDGDSKVLFKSVPPNCHSLDCSASSDISIERKSHLDKLVTACSSLEAPSSFVNDMPKAISQSTTTTSSPSSFNNSNQSASLDVAGSSKCGVDPPPIVRQFKYKRASTTCGKITSGASSLAGGRMDRQMQRLRRLCGAHQQCVAYSSPELASEISSIVHAAKSLSVIDSGGNCSHHRRSGKGTNKDRPRAQCTPFLSKASNHSVHAPASGASIDSVTTVGPGIFSGTFSGSLHPNIQDEEGRPKRDPQTILQILIDLLSATSQYEGQTGNIAMLPQLFKDNFHKQVTTDIEPSQQYEHQISRNDQLSCERRHYSESSRINLFRKDSNSLTVPTSQSATMSSYPLHRHMARSSKDVACHCRNSLCNRSYNPAERGGTHNYRCSRKYLLGHCRSQQSNSIGNGSNSACLRYLSASTKRSKKQAMNINVSRLKQDQENYTTREKLRRLKEKMQIRRMHRQSRKRAYAPYNNPSHEETFGSLAQQKVNELNMDDGAVLDMKIDELADFAGTRKADVALESQETVKV